MSPTTAFDANAAQAHRLLDQAAQQPNAAQRALLEARAHLAMRRALRHLPALQPAPASFTDAFCEVTP